MRSRLFTTLTLSFFVASLYAQQSKWVHPGADGKLVYARSPQGDRILDFSYAGYHGGGVALPKIPTATKLAPSGADDTAALQSAIDALAKKPLTNNTRGAIELAAGNFHLSDTIHITASGIVLRGAGSDLKSGTTVELTGNPHLGIDITGKTDLHATAATTLTDTYVPAGATEVHVANPSAFHPGDTVEITKPVTPAWVKFMGMDTLVRSGKDERWVGVTELKVLRHIRATQGTALELDVPLTDSIDARFFPGIQPAVTRVDVTGEISEVGIEDLRITAPPKAIALGKDPQFDGIRTKDLADSWLSNIHIEDATNAVGIDAGSERITVVNVDTLERIPVTTPAKPFDFSVNGSQILFDRCTGTGDTVFYMATQARQEGPVVFLHCRFKGDGHIQPHQRWSTGLLVDGCDVPGGGIDLMNRGTMGSGHGWTIGWSVLWNVHARTFTVQNPPGSANWIIGARGALEQQPMPTTGGPKGPPLPNGQVESMNKPVTPGSLYLAQLRDRLGPAALKAIGYTEDDINKIP